MNAPCKGCPNRFPGCQGSCERYGTYHKMMTERKKRREKESEINGYIAESIAKARKHKERMKRR